MKRAVAVASRSLLASSAAKRSIASFAASRTHSMPNQARYASSLGKILTAELAEEKSNKPEADEELEAIRKGLAKEFEFKEVLGSGVVKMVKKNGEEEITVEWNVQDEEQLNNEEEEEENEEAEPGVAIGFSVTIKKGESTLLFHLAASDELSIENVQVFKGDKSIEEAERYTGPQFHELDEKLQNAFTDFLAERGIDEDLAYYILSYSREKEQGEYVNWLESIKTFIK